MLKKVRTNSWIPISTKSYLGLFWAKIQLPSKFCGNLFSSFCVIWVTNQQTDTGDNKSFLGGGKNQLIMLKHTLTQANLLKLELI